MPEPSLTPFQLKFWLQLTKMTLVSHKTAFIIFNNIDRRQCQAEPLDEAAAQNKKKLNTDQENLKIY